MQSGNEIWPVYAILQNNFLQNSTNVADTTFKQV